MKNIFIALFALFFSGNASGELTKFQDDLLISGGKGPLMVVVPAGSFRMGSPSGEHGRDRNEGPVHNVRIEKFAVGVYEVTFDEWDACHKDGGCSGNPSDEEWGRGKRPVINIDWRQARDYVRWLSDQTGKEYRLLSESQWEYVARAGTTTRYWWGDKVGSNRANCRTCGSRWDGAKTAPVGSFKANPFGLYDVHGNVWEWVDDCWHNSYERAPVDGSAQGCGGDCNKGVLRGGSWSDTPEYLRSANRDRDTTVYRDFSNGFRIARTLP